MAGEEGVRRYRAFITYSHRDKRWASWLHRRLEFYRVPHRLVGRRTAAGVIQRRLTPIFRDREELATANDLSAKITQALENSDNLIVICSPSAARSKWVNEEIRRFRELGRGSRIFCFVVGGQPQAGDEDRNERLFPATLCGAEPGDREETTGTAEPLAADARPGQDGRNLALLKLVAGLLGVDLDELRRRELQRRNRRWATITVLSLAVMTATSLLALDATVQRGIAEHRRAQAESLVAFMLGNLRSELEPIGRLDLLDMLGKRVLAYYASQNLRSLNASSLERRAEALQLIGNVYKQRGQLKEALSAYHQAEATTARLLASRPGDPERIYAHAQSVFYVATIAYKRGDMKRAEAGMRRYDELARRLVKADPANAKWQWQVENASTNLGIVLYTEHKYKNAVAILRQGVASAASLAHEFPDDTSKQTDLAMTRAWLADAQSSLGHFGEARRQRLMQRTIYRRLLRADPDNNGLRFSLATNERALATLAIDRGDLDDAATKLQSVIDLTNKLVKLDQTNTLWKDVNAGAWGTLGEVYYARGEFTAAAQAAKTAEGIARALLKMDSSVLDWQVLKAGIGLLSARLQAQKGRHADALRTVSRVATDLAAMPAGKRSAGKVERLLVSARLLQGDELRALHRPGDIEAWKRVIEITSGNHGNITPEIQTVMAEAYLRLGKAEEAKRIAKELEGLGYLAPEFLNLKQRMRMENGERVTGRSF